MSLFGIDFIGDVDFVGKILKEGLWLGWLLMNGED